MEPNASPAHPAAALNHGPDPMDLAVIGCLIILLAVILTEPICREGYIASMSFTGWLCIPEYKPNR
jgi:hypothetical protein